MEEKVSWDAEVRILFNRFILADVGKALLIGVGGVALLLAVLLLLEGLPGPVSLRDWKYPLLLLGVTFGLGALFILLFWNNKYSMKYFIDKRGIRLVTRGEQRRKNWLMNWLLIGAGIFSRRPTAVGTGVLGLTRQDMSLNWKSIRRIKVYPREGVIVLKAGLLGKMIVFCTQENFQQVRDLIAKGTPLLRN